MKRKIKEREQLGVDKGTATGRLRQDIIWKLLQETGRTKCYVCGEEMTRETFSIEHKIPWLDKDNAKELFFDLNNISFSHLKCNMLRKRGTKANHGTSTRYSYGCRCELCTKASTDERRKNYKPEARRKKYLSKGY